MADPVTHQDHQRDGRGGSHVDAPEQWAEMRKALTEARGTI